MSINPTLKNETGVLYYDSITCWFAHACLYRCAGMLMGWYTCYLCWYMEAVHTATYVQFICCRCCFFQILYGVCCYSVRWLPYKINTL